MVSLQVRTVTGFLTSSSQDTKSTCHLSIKVSSGQVVCYTVSWESEQLIGCKLTTHKSILVLVGMVRCFFKSMLLGLHCGLAMLLRNFTWQSKRCVAKKQML